MFDIGWSELMVIGIVALIVVGPKDLPGMFRTLGKFTAKAKSMAREFTKAMEDAADEAGVKDVAKGLKDATNPTKMGLNKIKEAADEFTNWDPSKKGGGSGKKGSEASGLSEERAEAARKIHKATADKASARLAAEAAAEAPAAAKPAAKPRARAAAKPAAKPAVKPRARATAKPAAKPAARKPAAAKPAKKPAAKKPAAKNPAKKPAAKGSAK